MTNIDSVSRKEEGFDFYVIDHKTGKEADIEQIALKEEWASDLLYCGMQGFAILDDGGLILCDEFGNYSFADMDRFEVVWINGKRKE